MCCWTQGNVRLTDCWDGVLLWTSAMSKQHSFLSVWPSLPAIFSLSFSPFRLSYSVSISRSTLPPGLDLLPDLHSSSELWPTTSFLIKKNDPLPISGTFDGQTCSSREFKSRAVRSVFQKYRCCENNTLLVWVYWLKSVLRGILLLFSPSQESKCVFFLLAGGGKGIPLKIDQDLLGNYTHPMNKKKNIMGCYLRFSHVNVWWWHSKTKILKCVLVYVFCHSHILWFKSNHHLVCWIRGCLNISIQSIKLCGLKPRESKTKTHILSLYNKNVRKQCVN